jgi:hypothetical protein
MTPQQHAERVVADVKDHKMFNVDTDGTWVRYIASAIKNALDESLPDANDLDEVVHALGIEDSDTTPVEAVKNLQTELTAWRNVARRAGVCMSCALDAHEPFGCTDCLNTGWNGGAPTGFIRELPREPGTCKCGAAPVNKDGMCATCADEKPGPIPLWKAFHAMAWPKFWGIETTDYRAIEAGLEIVIAPCMPEHAAKSVAAIFNQQRVVPRDFSALADFTHRETLLTLLELLNPIHGSLDKQTYDDKVKEGFDAPPDAEYSVNVTAQQESDLTQAVCILESRLRGGDTVPFKGAKVDAGP